MEVNEEKRNKFMEYAGKRVNNVLHDMQILEPMARSNAYDFTKEDVEEMFSAMQETLNDVKTEFNKKFEEKARAEKKVFSFGMGTATKKVEEISKEITNNHEEVEQLMNDNIEEENEIADEITTAQEEATTSATAIISADMPF